MVVVFMRQHPPEAATDKAAAPAGAALQLEAISADGVDIATDGAYTRNYDEQNGGRLVL